MSYSEVKGDLIEMAKAGKFGIIIHGCNCFCTMGAGIAARIKREFPEAYAADCCTISGFDKRGTFTWAQSQEHVVTIVNAYTQLGYGDADDQFDYLGFQRILRQLSIFVGGARVGFPMIGAGLAGGDWERIKAMIQEEMIDCNVTVVIYEPL